MWFARVREGETVREESRPIRACCMSISASFYLVAVVTTVSRLPTLSSLTSSSPSLLAIVSMTEPAMPRASFVTLADWKEMKGGRWVELLIFGLD